MRSPNSRLTACETGALTVARTALVAVGALLLSVQSMAAYDTRGASRAELPRVAGATLSVTPDGGSASAPGFKNGNYVDFTVTLVEGDWGAYWTSCSVGFKGSSVLSCTGGDGGPETLMLITPNEPQTFRVFYDTGQPGSGWVTLQATLESCSPEPCSGDTGYFDVNVGNPVPPTIAVQGNDRRLDPRVASSLEAGPQAQYRPHELVVRHRLPGYRTMDAERVVSLVYGSQSAAARVVMPFDVTLHANPPDQLTARLDVSGLQQGSAIYFSTSGWLDDQARRLALLFDASGFATGSYGYRIVITSVYGSNAYEAVLTGRLAVLNEGASPLGRGWRVAGLQRLHSNGDTITIVGCECANEAHAFTVFYPSGSGAYVPPPGEHSTLEAVPGGGWKRRMKDGTTHYFGVGGLQDSTVDRNGNKTSHAYDGSGRLTAITDPVGWATTFSYPSGQVSVSIPGGRTATLTLSGGQLTQIADPDGKVVSFGYDGSGRLSSRTSKRGDQTTYSYDYGWLPSGVSLPIAASRAYASPRTAGLADYPSEGTSTTPKVAPAPSAVTGTYRDARGHLWTLNIHRSLAAILWKDPLGASTTWTRNDAGQATSRILANGRDTRFTYDAKGNVTEVREVATGARWRFTYEPTYFNMTTAVTPTADTTTVTYDSRGNPNSLILPEDSVWAIDYNARGQPVRVTRYLFSGFKGTFVYSDSLFYDENGSRNTIRHRRQNSSTGWDTVAVSYDAAGRMTEVRDHRGGKVNFAYDAMNRVTSRTDQLGRVETWARNAAGLDSVWTNRRGQTITFAYDALDRRTEKVSAESTVFEYDPESNLTRAYDADSDVTFFYDALGRDTATVQNGKRIGYTHYGGLPDRRTMRDPDGGVHTYTYDLLSRLTQIQDPEGATTTFAYDLSNRRTNRTQANGVTVSYTYDRNSRVTRMAATNEATTYASFDYTYDPSGLRSGWTYENGDVFSFSHDFRGQLKNGTLKDAAGNTLYSSGFDYDGANNRVSGGDYSGYTYDAANRLASTETSSYSYDLDGNLVSEDQASTSYTYSYDREGRLVAQTGPSLTVSYKYDALGRRIEQDVNGTVTRFVHDAYHVLLDLDGSGSTIARYTHGPVIDEIVSARRGGATYYYLQDALSSVVRILDASRIVKNSYEYLPWGEIRSQTEPITNRFTYTGRARNPDGLTMHYRARNYLVNFGRFSQEDPLGFADGINLYSYVQNSPCTVRDPFGLQSSCEQKAVAIAATGVAASLLGTSAMVAGGILKSPTLVAVGAGHLFGGLALMQQGAAIGASCGACPVDSEKS